MLASILVDAVAFPFSLQSIDLVLACAQYYNDDNRKVQNLEGVILLNNTPKMVQEAFHISQHNQYDVCDMKITNAYYGQTSSIAMRFLNDKLLQKMNFMIKFRLRILISNMKMRLF